MVLLSACRLGEEPLQQAKGFASGDVVFDAQNISKTTVAQCQDDSCRTKTPLSAKLHQVALSDKPLEGALQFNNLHISFEAGNKTYTCTRLSAPMGKMTLLQRGVDDDKYCYAQAKDKDYVQQFALACLQEEGWHLVAGFEAEALQKFTCEKGDTKISSACFFDAEECGTKSWPVNIRSIYDVKSAEPTTASAKGTVITGETKLAEVMIKAEWKLSRYGVSCSAFADSFSFVKTAEPKSKTLAVSDGNKTVSEITDNFSCLHGDDALSITPFTPPKGICARMQSDSNLQNINDCAKEDVNYIKITFAPKGN